jgi:hypothetical protein
VLQLWTAPVTVAGEAHRNGSAELEMLDDITDRIALHYREEQYDAKTEMLMLEADVTNMSSLPIYGPLKIRILRLSSLFGKLEVLGAKNDATGTGAVCDWTPALRQGVLQPLQTSNRVSLILRLQGGTAAITDFSGVAFEFRVLAGKHAKGHVVK